MGIQIHIELGNAAFEDSGRDLEIERILVEAAQKYEDGVSDFNLYDINGNKVGRLETAPDDATPPAVKSEHVTLSIDTGNAAFEDNTFEAATIIRKAASRFGDGRTEFALLDSNGNSVGSASLVDAAPEPSLSTGRSTPTSSNDDLEP